MLNGQILGISFQIISISRTTWVVGIILSLSPSPPALILRCACVLAKSDLVRKMELSQSFYRYMLVQVIFGRQCSHYLYSLCSSMFIVRNSVSAQNYGVILVCSIYQYVILIGLFLFLFLFLQQLRYLIFALGASGGSSDSRRVNTSIHRREENEFNNPSFIFLQLYNSRFLGDPTDLPILVPANEVCNLACLGINRLRFMEYFIEQNCIHRPPAKCRFINSQ